MAEKSKSTLVASWDYMIEGEMYFRAGTVTSSEEPRPPSISVNPNEVGR